MSKFPRMFQILVKAPLLTLLIWLSLRLFKIYTIIKLNTNKKECTCELTTLFLKGVAMRNLHQRREGVVVLEYCTNLAHVADLVAPETIKKCREQYY